MHIYIYICSLYVCMYIYIYIHIYIHIDFSCTHIRTYIYAWLTLQRRVARSYGGGRAPGAPPSDNFIIIIITIPIPITVINARHVYIPQRGVQWKQGVVIYMMLYTSLLHNTTPIRCTPLRLHPPVMNTHSCAGYFMQGMSGN